MLTDLMPTLVRQFLNGTDVYLGSFFRAQIFEFPALEQQGVKRLRASDDLIVLLLQRRLPRQAQENNICASWLYGAFDLFE